VSLGVLMTSVTSREVGEKASADLPAANDVLSQNTRNAGKYLLGLPMDVKHWAERAVKSLAGGRRMQWMVDVQDREQSDRAGLRFDKYLLNRHAMHFYCCCCTGIHDHVSCQCKTRCHDDTPRRWAMAHRHQKIVRLRELCLTCSDSEPHF
jgi:hypothetical protein